MTQVIISLNFNVSFHIRHKKINDGMKQPQMDREIGFILWVVVFLITEASALKCHFTEFS